MFTALVLIFLYKNTGKKTELQITLLSYWQLWISLLSLRVLIWVQTEYRIRTVPLVQCKNRPDLEGLVFVSVAPSLEFSSDSCCCMAFALSIVRKESFQNYKLFIGEQ